MRSKRAAEFWRCKRPRRKNADACRGRCPGDLAALQKRKKKRPGQGLCRLARGAFLCALVLIQNGGLFASPPRAVCFGAPLDVAKPLSGGGAFCRRLCPGQSGEAAALPAAPLAAPSAAPPSYYADFRRQEHFCSCRQGGAQALAICFFDCSGKPVFKRGERKRSKFPKQKEKFSLQTLRKLV